MVDLCVNKLSYPAVKLKNVFSLNYSVKYNNLKTRLMFNYIFKEKIKKYNNEVNLNLQNKKHFQTMSRGPIAKKKKSLIYFSMPFRFKKHFIKCDTDYYVGNLIITQEGGSVKSFKRSLNKNFLFLVIICLK